MSKENNAFIVLQKVFEGVFKVNKDRFEVLVNDYYSLNQITNILNEYSDVLILDENGKEIYYK